jgi:hypothetical protein
MSSQDTARQTQRKEKETSLREAVTGMVRRLFESDGLETAKEGFEKARALFAFAPGWHDIEEEVHQFFVEKRREALQAERERQQQLDSAMVEGLAKGIDVNQANLLTGAYSQAAYQLTTSTIGGHKQ